VEEARIRATFSETGKEDLAAEFCGFIVFAVQNNELHELLPNKKLNTKNKK